MTTYCGSAMIFIRVREQDILHDSGRARGFGVFALVEGFDMGIAAAHVSVDEDGDAFIWINPGHERWQGATLDAIAAEVRREFDIYVQAKIAETEVEDEP